MKARKLRPVFSYRVATRRNCLMRLTNCSTKFRSLLSHAGRVKTLAFRRRLQRSWPLARGGIEGVRPYDLGACSIRLSLVQREGKRVITEGKRVITDIDRLRGEEASMTRT